MYVCMYAFMHGVYGTYICIANRFKEQMKQLCLISISKNYSDNGI